MLLTPLVMVLARAPSFDFPAAIQSDAQKNTTVDAILWWIFMLIGLPILINQCLFFSKEPTQLSSEWINFIVICCIAGCVIAIARIVMLYTLMNTDDDPSSPSPILSGSLRQQMIGYGWASFGAMVVVTLAVWVASKKINKS